MIIAGYACKQRESNVELLRILAIIGVIILHYNNSLMGGAFTFAPVGSVNRWLLYWLECMCACAVDLFMVISGYFMCKSKGRNIWKPLELIVQVVLFNEAIYLAKVVFTEKILSLNSLIAHMVPANYFVILYCAVYLLSPYISLAMEHLSQKNLKKMMIMLVLVLSVYPTLVDMAGAFVGHPFTGLNSIGAWGDQSGYTLINFMLCWMVGAYLRKMPAKVNGSMYLLGYVSLTVIEAIYGSVMARFGMSLEYVFSYCNPIIIGQAVCIFCAFRKMDIGCISPINVLAKGSFSVYLLHSLFLKYLKIEKFAAGSPLLLLVHILASSIGIYLICWCVWFGYDMAMKPFWRWCQRRCKYYELGIAE